MDQAERLALAALCDELDSLRVECAHGPDQRQHLLARIETEAKARRPILAMLDELLGTVRADTVRTLGGGLPGFGPGQADEEQFGCPDGACSRIAGTYPAGPVPRCRVTGDPMSRR
jgi:hypothetical protein